MSQVVSYFNQVALCPITMDVFLISIQYPVGAQKADYITDA